VSRAYGMSAEPCRCVVHVAVPQFYAIGRESPEARRLALAFSAARMNSIRLGCPVHVCLLTLG